MTEKEKMISGELYLATDENLTYERLHIRNKLNDYNNRSLTKAEKANFIGGIFGSCGEAPNIEPNFKCDYGYNIHVGNNFYANYDCIMLDVCSITIGNDVMFGPRVSIYTATHPLDAPTRVSGLEYGKPVTIGNNVWIGGDSVINPGIEIGENSIVGSGSVVTHNVEPNVVVAGNPAKVIKRL